MSEFRVVVELGNDAMQTPEDVARVLRDVARRLVEEGFEVCPISLRDENGNTIGKARLR